MLLDLLPPIITLLPTTTTVNISWTQPADSFPALLYRVSLTRVLGGKQLLCDSVVDYRPAVNTSITIEYIGLHEFSTYVVTVSIISPDYGINSTFEFTTLSSSRLTCSNKFN